jgi:Prenyltransferase and squalene oxidase repeat
MQAVIPAEGPPAKGQVILSFVQDFFPSFLRNAQNADGGWGYRPGSLSSTEPTAWSILALRAHEPAHSKILSSASAWLRRSQLPKGAWPTSSGKDPGCWMTALACLALLKLATPSDDAVARGLKWLCTTWPAEGNLMWRLRQVWMRHPQIVVHQDNSLRGWSWTPDTASWVEPTAYALLLLQNVPQKLQPPEARERMQLGEKMLYDRACAGGGWNAGNPLVYGVPGVPRIGPTAWALLALRHHMDRAVNMKGLAWLEQNYNSIGSPGSLALAGLGLSVYGRPAAPIEPELYKFYQRSQFLQSIPVTAWALLALDGVPDWLEVSFQGKGT